MVNFKPIFKSKHINGFSGDESISEQEMSILNAHPYLPLEVLRIIDAWNFYEAKGKTLEEALFYTVSIMSILQNLACVCFKDYVKTRSYIAMHSKVYRQGNEIHRL